MILEVYLKIQVNNFIIKLIVYSMNIIKKLFSRNKNENIKKENSTRNIEGDVKE